MTLQPGPLAIPVVVFDLGGVLCRFLPERRLAALATVSGRPTEELRQRLYDSGFIDRADTGQLTRVAEYRTGCELVGIDIEYAEYRRLWCTAFEPDPEVVAVARSLRGRVGTAILTNNGPVLLDALEHDLAEIASSVDARFISALFGATKPAEAVYRGVERALGVTASALVLVDDSLVNVHGATAVGWRAVHFRSAEQLKQELAELLGL